MESAQSIHTLLHTLWTKAVGTNGYNKEEWKRLAAFVYDNINVNQLRGRNPKAPDRPTRYERKPVI
jgi:hypothetical protein